MYDYMRALYKKFCTPPDCEAERREWESVHADLHARLDRDERKLLLRIIDLQCVMQDKAALHSFLAGYKLADSIHCELAQKMPYSFELDEEREAEALYLAGKENHEQTGNAKIAPQNKE